MKTNELMVGDIVRHKRTKEVISIFEIDDDRNVINNEPDGYCSEKNIEIDDVEPIPLTPEILEKNGFYHETNVGYIDDDYNGRQIIYDFWNHNLKIIYNYKTMLDIEEWLDHIHVHELQHALKLCGIDKTIEL